MQSETEYCSIADSFIRTRTLLRGQEQKAPSPVAGHDLSLSTLGDFEVFL
jgi:hypothetical protein